MANDASEQKGKETDLGLQIIQSYERWGTWLVSLSVTAAAALSVRHGIADKSCLSLGEFLQFFAVGFLLLVAVFFSAFLVGNLKYVAVRFVSGQVNDIEEVLETPLNEKLRDYGLIAWIPGVEELSRVQVWLASAIAGIAFGSAIAVFVLSEFYLSWLRVE